MSFNPISAILGLTGGALSEEIELTIQSLSSALGAVILNQPKLAEDWKAHLDDSVRKNGKFLKSKIAYTPIAPLPVFWEYTCARCRVFNKDKKTCEWVNEMGFPQPGIIHPLAWCAIWMPFKDEKPFEWLQRKPAFLTEEQPTFP